MPMTAGSAATTGLSAEIKAKVQSKNPEFSAIADNWDWLFDSIAEAVIEHIVANAQVTVSVVGADAGAALSTLARLQTMTQTLVPDLALQLDSTAVPTVAALTSVVLSAPGLID